MTESLDDCVAALLGAADELVGRLLEEPDGARRRPDHAREPHRATPATAD